MQGDVGKSRHVNSIIGDRLSQNKQGKHIKYLPSGINIQGFRNPQKIHTLVWHIPLNYKDLLAVKKQKLLVLKGLGTL